MTETTNTPDEQVTPKKRVARRRNILSAKDWAQVETDVRRAERNPDPAQESILDVPGVSTEGK